MAEAAQQQGFSWANLVILIVVALVAWPLYKTLRSAISRNRRERWARQEGWTREEGRTVEESRADHPGDDRHDQRGE